MKEKLEPVKMAFGALLRRSRAQRANSPQIAPIASR